MGQIFHGALTTVSGTTTFNDILQPDVLKIFMSTFIHLLESSRVRGFGGDE